ncbi:MAG: hypothetical protein KTR31_09405 [Myxococcales bacterium]|nr:hypothetical protein [Myxococcales bacterium]
MRWMGIAALMACSGGGGADSNIDTDTPDTGTPDTDTPDPTAPGIDATPLLEGLEGVWRDGQARPLDLAEEDGWLFARAEWPAGEMARWVLGRTDGGAVVRNTSRIAGRDLDLQATLVSSDNGTWRFCEPKGGCSELAIDVTLSGYDLTISTEASGEPAEVYSAQRLRDVPEGTFVDVRVGDPDPTLPTLTVQASIFQPPASSVTAVLAVARSRCQPGCVPSRVLLQSVKAGAKSVSWEVPELHTGLWYVTAFLDQNGNANPSTSYQPDAGDLFALPDRELTLSDDQTLNLDLSLEL